DLATQDFAGTWDSSFVFFCFAATALSIGIITLLSFLILKDRGKRGEFIQASYRSSAAILGIAFIYNIYGDRATGMGPLMVIGSVPLYNIFAVLILTLTAEESAPDKSGSGTGDLIKKALIGIIKNPLLIGVFAGLAWSLLGLPMSGVPDKVTDSLASLATPLGLMSMGASFRPGKALEDLRPALAASFIKLFGLAALFLPLALRLGFAGEQLVAILVMLGSATTVSCYVMAKNMGHEGTLTSNVVMLTTFGCSFSLTLWLFLLKSMGMI
ncbi:MAG: AEC family transporter, partial [Lachnospiraceae bacterium]|nr:AEC family transporter [Lachnospiraceae bacterium]